MRKLTDLHNQYRVLTALRGPDIHVNDELASLLKHYVTERLRGMIFDKDSCYGDITYKKLTQQNIRGLSKKLTKVKRDKYIIFSGLRHFISHLIDAVKSTRNHPIWGGNVNSLLSILIDVEINSRK